MARRSRSAGILQHHDARVQRGHEEPLRLRANGARLDRCKQRLELDPEARRPEAARYRGRNAVECHETGGGESTAFEPQSLGRLEARNEIVNGAVRRERRDIVSP